MTFFLDSKKISGCDYEKYREITILSRQSLQYNKEEQSIYFSGWQFESNLCLKYKKVSLWRCLFISHIEAKNQDIEIISSERDSFFPTRYEQILQGIVFEPYLQNNYEFVFDLAHIEDLTIYFCVGVIQLKNVRQKYNFHLITHKNSKIKYDESKLTLKRVLFYNSETQILDCNEFSGSDEDLIKKYFSDIETEEYDEDSE